LNIPQGIILGLIQGFCEFLPISSSGHLVLFQKIFGLKEGVLTFDIALHIATLFGLFYFLRKDIIAILKKPLDKPALLILAALIPTAVIGVMFNDVFEKIFSSGATLSIEFIITAIVLWLAENAKRTNKRKGIDDTTYIDAGLIGVAQGIAILPGISRSGFTLACSLLRGLDREFAVRFSFLLSIPAILGAAAFDCYKILKTGYSFTANIEIWPFIAGIITAALAGCIAIKFMLKKISKLNLKMFSYYLFALSAFILVDQLFFGKFFEKIIF